MKQDTPEPVTVLPETTFIIKKSTLLALASLALLAVIGAYQMGKESKDEKIVKP